MTPAAIITEIDRRQNQHLADMEPIKKRIALTDGEARRRANDLNAHVDAINTLESIKTFIVNNTPTQG